MNYSGLIFKLILIKNGGIFLGGVRDLVKKHQKRVSKAVTFSSFEEENQYEYERRKHMTKEERLHEFEVLQQRRWGADWAKKPMVIKVATEKLPDRSG